MNAVLKKKTEEWMQLERKTNEQRREADIFYQNNLMSLIEKDYQRRNKKKLFEKVDYLIMSVGTSYEPLVLNINLLQPGRILFLYTEKSEPTLNRIVNYCGLEVTRYQKERVTETDPLTLYKEIKNVYLEWNEPERIYIDFTGGTKAMATAAAMAGALIDVQLIYLGCEEYLVDFRKPNPGTENLCFIDNPIDVILSLAYTLLTKEVAMALTAESFETHLGFLHGIRYGRKSLALDIVEEFRQPAVDRLVLKVFNKGIIGKYDFDYPEGRPVELNEEGFRRFCTAYEHWMNGSDTASSEKCFRSRIRDQAAALKKAVISGEAYLPYSWEERNVCGLL